MPAQDITKNLQKKEPIFNQLLCSMIMQAVKLRQEPAEMNILKHNERCAMTYKITDAVSGRIKILRNIWAWRSK